MRRHLTVILAALTCLPSAMVSAQGQNPVNLWLVDLHWTGSRLTVGAPVKLTHDDGNNSQPSFTPDGRAIVFSVVRDTGADARSDIYRIDLATRAETRITHTPENENSPTVNERGEYVAVRWLPATLFKEFGPWVYAADGTPIRGVLRGPDTTGYYTPLPNGDYALTRPKSKTFTLGLFSAKTGNIVDVDSGLPALPAQRIPGERALSYVRIDSGNAHNTIRRFDLTTQKTSTLGPTLVGRTAHAWVAGHHTILMTRGNVLYARTATDTAWRAVTTFDNAELRNPSAYVVSPAGDKLILTSSKRIALATILRDSLEGGRSGVDVAAMVIAWRDGGKLGDVDITEGPIGALGDDRLQKKKFADAIAIHTLATTLFPKSFRALGRLGDAQRASGDSTSARASYRKALDANPRSTDAERAAAAAVEKKIATP
jgi:dipeptidyl aminopeptidase/acylaminoacyl peptidase